MNVYPIQLQIDLEPHGTGPSFAKDVLFGIKINGKHVAYYANTDELLEQIRTHLKAVTGYSDQ